jgi:hypothetical protein
MFDDVLHRLRKPLASLSDVTRLLKSAYAALSNTSTEPSSSIPRRSSISRLISKSLALQEAIRQHVLPVWFDELQTGGHMKVVDRIFGIAGEARVVTHIFGICAFQELGRSISPTFEYGRITLPKLLEQYPVNVMARVIFGGRLALDEAERSSIWNKHLRVAFGLSGKALNAYGVEQVPAELQHM